jgi:hypothetical protein
VLRRLLLALGIVLPSVLFTPVAAPAQGISCSPAEQVLPGGEVATNTEDPQIPTYCLPEAAVHAPTRVSGANDWVDTFVPSGGNWRMDDGDFGYRQFEAGNIGPTRHLVVGDGWINDQGVRYGGGIVMRPDRTFHAEGGKLVMEADVAAGTNAYRGNAWPEFVITTQDHPDIQPPDDPEQAYGYGRWRGSPTFGCRLQDAGSFTCATFTGTTLGATPNTSDTAPCFSLQQDRLWELSFFQGCGDYFPGGVHFGGIPDVSGPDGPLSKYFRQCSPTQDYDACMDRIRVEITKTSMVWYVNGARYFEDSGWDSLHQIPDALFTQPVYAYFVDFQTIDDTQQAFRFHWGRLAVNPHQANGSFTAPSASAEWLEANGGTPPPPTATPVAPAATPTPPPAATSTPPPAATPTAPPAATATAMPTSVPATPTATVAPPPSPTPVPHPGHHGRGPKPH